MLIVTCHFRKNHCLVIGDLLATCKLLQEGLKASSAVMQSLDPEFVLIGSTMEGTRIGSGDEVDLTIKFRGLYSCPFTVSQDDPLHLRVVRSHPRCSCFPSGCNHRPHHILEEYLDRDGVLEYPRFLRFLLESVSSTLATIEAQGKLPSRIRIKQHNNKYSPCKMCLEVSRERAKFAHYPVVQCVDCLVACSMTKIGPCLQFQWCQDADDDSPVNIVRPPKTCVVDLVPVYPIDRSDVTALFTQINRKMLEERPVGWLANFVAYVKKDRAIMESHRAAKTGQVEVAVKLFNFGGDTTCALVPEHHWIRCCCLFTETYDNHVIRPGQVLGVERLRHDALHGAYCLIKALKDALSLDLESYFVKKVLLREEFLTLASSKVRFEFLFTVLSHPELTARVRRTVDFGQWKAQEGWQDLPLVSSLSRKASWRRVT